MAVIYVCGFFSLSLMQMVAFASPLWGNHVQLSAIMLGTVIGARAVTPLIYSIHFGALMDAIGVRRIMAIFTAVCVVTPILHPLLPPARPAAATAGGSRPRCSHRLVSRASGNRTRGRRQAQADFALLLFSRQPKRPRTAPPRVAWSLAALGADSR